MLITSDSGSTEEMVRRPITSAGVPFDEVSDKAAFYGPKVDGQIESAIGREFTIATNQVDFAVPERFGLRSVNASGEEQPPLCIHRAPLGTHERVVGFLIEHYGGAFPAWLAPEQARIIRSRMRSTTMQSRFVGEWSRPAYGRPRT